VRVSSNDVQQRAVCVPGNAGTRTRVTCYLEVTVTHCSSPEAERETARTWPGLSLGSRRLVDRSEVPIARGLRAFASSAVLDGPSSSCTLLVLCRTVRFPNHGNVPG
jgi:hypothetical protein